jgi:cytochrome c
VSCNSCHPDGEGLEREADRKDKDLEKMVNSCVKNPVKGNGINANSAEMAEIISYLKSLK